MNRVVLAGCLAGTPMIAYTRCGLAIAMFSLLVPRPGRDRAGKKQPEHTDEIECVAFQQLAVELHTWGEGGLRVNLEGRLVPEEAPQETGPPLRSLRVYVEYAYPSPSLPEPSGDRTLNPRPGLRLPRFPPREGA